ncbi:MAG: pilus assembly protein [Acidobacteriia bacterium]|nr:pilus assembly protein [Terriglobia bacterium]
MMDMHIGGQTGASPGVRVEARSSGKRARARARDEQGQALLEFAFVLPVLLTLLLGVIVFGLALHNYLTLTNATNLGAQLLSMSRGQTLDPCQTTSQAVYAAAPNLIPANLKFTIVLNGTSVATNQPSPVTCSGGQQYLVASQNAQVTVTYPCNLNFFIFNPAPGCTLTAQTTEIVQ